MRKIRTLLAILVFLITGFVAKGQPIPVELMMGNKYGVVDVAFSKNFSQNSKFGFFHMNSVQFDYNEEFKNSFLLQDLIYVEAIKNIRLVGGVVYSKAGFNTTAGVHYIYTDEKVVFLCAPRVNIESQPSYDIMTILQYKTPLNDKLKLFTRLKLLNLFDKGGNIKSYQWLRLGLEIKGIQFGLAANLDEYGPHPSVESNFGLFIRKEIF